MSEPASTSVPISRLRVAIAASEPQARMRLSQWVEAAGHEVVAAADAQVVLCDGAGAAEIEAALRAVAVGLAAPHDDPGSAEFEELSEPVATDLLTPRELDVLVAISDGMSNKAVARKLGISLHTVKFHVESLFRKLGARTRAEAVARGLERRKAETLHV